MWKTTECQFFPPRNRWKADRCVSPRKNRKSPPVQPIETGGCLCYNDNRRQSTAADCRQMQEKFSPAFFKRRRSRGRGALVAVRRRRNPHIGVSFCKAFFFAPTWSKKKRRSISLFFEGNAIRLRPETAKRRRGAEPRAEPLRTGTFAESSPPTEKT